MGDRARVEAYLEGVVQGVGMRLYVREIAHALGLTGYVKNLADGRVEVVAEGSSRALKRLLERLKNSRVGHVTSVEFTWAEPTGEFTDFRIER